MARLGWTTITFLLCCLERYGMPNVVQTHDICHITWVILSFKYRKGTLIAIVHQFQPVNNQHCDWTSPCGSYYDCKTPLSTSYWETRKLEIRYLQDLEITWHSWYHTARSGQGETDRGGRERRVLWGSGWGPGVFLGSLFNSGFKQKSRNLKCRNRE